MEFLILDAVIFENNISGYEIFSYSHISSITMKGGLYMLCNALMILEDLDTCDTLNVEVETYFMNKLKNELKSILGTKVPTPPNPNAQQVCWSIKLNINGIRKKFTGTTEKALYKNILDFFGLHNVTVQNYFEEWLESEEQSFISPSTRLRKIQRWNRFWASSLGTLPISKLTTREIEEAITHMQVIGVTQKDLSEALNPLRGLTRKAVREGLLPSDPFQLININWTKCIRSKKQNEKNSDRVFIEDEMDKVINVCNQMINRPNNRCSAFYGIKILRLTGMRVGELVALKWADIDYNELVIHIHARETSDGHNRVVAEGTKGTHTHDTYVVCRDIPITEEVIDILAEIKTFNLANGFIDEDFIFCGINGRSSIKSVENALWKACDLAGLSTKKSPHDIRRTVATVLYRKGTPIKVIQTYLGHADERTTRSYIYDDSSTTTYYNTIRANI